MKILFICSGNTCRSPMAHAMFEKIAKERSLNAECYGAGTATYSGMPASDNSVAVMKEIGVDISNYKSTSLGDLNLNDFDLFVPMTFSHVLSLVKYGIEKKKIYLFDKDVSDPYGGNIEVYRATRDEIAENLNKLADFVEEKLKRENDI